MQSRAAELDKRVASFLMTFSCAVQRSVAGCEDVLQALAACAAAAKSDALARLQARAVRLDDAAEVYRVNTLQLRAYAAARSSTEAELAQLTLADGVPCWMVLRAPAVSIPFVAAPSAPLHPAVSYQRLLRVVDAHLGSSQHALANNGLRVLSLPEAVRRFGSRRQLPYRYGAHDVLYLECPMLDISGVRAEDWLIQQAALRVHVSYYATCNTDYISRHEDTKLFARDGYLYIVLRDAYSKTVVYVHVDVTTPDLEADGACLCHFTWEHKQPACDLHAYKGSEFIAFLAETCVCAAHADVDLRGLMV